MRILMPLEGSSTPTHPSVPAVDPWLAVTSQGYITAVILSGVVAAALLPSLRYWLFTPEIQWQPRGNVLILSGVVAFGGLKARTNGR